MLLSFQRLFFRYHATATNRINFRVYLADLEEKLAKAGSKILRLDADGNINAPNVSGGSDNALSK